MLLLNCIPKRLTGRTIRVGATKTYPTLNAAVTAGAVTNGTTVVIDDGTYSDVSIITANDVTITSSTGTAGSVIFDNASAGGLAQGGKSMILFSGQKNWTIKGIWFKNVGLPGGAGISALGSGGGNQAGIRVQSSLSASTGKVSFCAFDNCVSGIFGNDTNLHLMTDHCDFGHVTSNGQSQDGFSHDVYAEFGTWVDGIAGVTASGSTFPGCTYSNSAKSRCASTIFYYMACRKTDGGSVIDIPDAGIFSLNNCRLDYPITSFSDHKLFAYAAESAINGYQNTSITNCTLNIGFNNALITNGGSTMVFTTNNYGWYGTTPQINTSGAGAFSGLVTSGTSLGSSFPVFVGPRSGIS